MFRRKMKIDQDPVRWIVASCALLLVASLFTAVSFAQAPPDYSQQPPPGYPQQPPPGYPQQPPPGYPQQAPGYPQQAPPAYPQQAPPAYPPQELDQLVSRIALYPDPLLAQILTASTYPNDIPAAAQWADQHHYLTGPALAQAITADQLPWDPSVQALLPFPSVLDMMASDMGWTQELGNAVLAQRPDVMDSVQRMRHEAVSYGYLRSNQAVVVGTGPYITIMPVNPAFIVVPAYNPVVVFARPRPGFFVGGAIGFGYGINIGVAFQPWGWGVSRFDWGAHTVIINNVPWGRTWVNRSTYVHPYSVRRYARTAPRPPEQHELRPRSPEERAAPKAGRPRVQEKHGKEEKHDETR